MQVAARTHMQPSGSFSFCPLNQASPVSVMTAEWEVSMPCMPLHCLSQNADAALAVTGQAREGLQ